MLSHKTKHKQLRKVLFGITKPKKYSIRNPVSKKETKNGVVQNHELSVARTDSKARSSVQI